MNDLVKKHPLFGQLAQYDANIQALSLGALVPHDLAPIDVQYNGASPVYRVTFAVDNGNKLRGYVTSGGTVKLWRRQSRYFSGEIFSGARKWGREADAYMRRAYPAAAAPHSISITRS